MGSSRSGDNQPIFIVGSGRSGTTILYEILCTHPELSWFSNLSEKAQRIPQVASLSNLYRSDRLRRHRPRWLPIPAEGYPIWNDITQLPDERLIHPLTEEDVNPGAIDRFRRHVYQHQRWQRKPRFINKNTRNTRRIRYLNRIAPEALFIHVTRDPRATAASLVRVAWWRDLSLWTRGGSTPDSLQEVPNAQLAAELWRSEVERAINDREALDKSRYLEVRYEDLVREPSAVLKEIATFCHLVPSTAFRRSAATFVVANQNERFRSRLSDDEVRIVEQETCSVAAALGYSFDE